MNTVTGMIMLLVLLLIAGLVALSNYFYKIAVKRTHGKPNLYNVADVLGEELVEEEYRGYIAPDVTSWLNRQPIKRVTIRAQDGLRLNAYYIPAPKPSRMAVILAHGYSFDALTNMSALAKMFQEQFGCHLLLPDARGHGQSEGHYVGFGWHERMDMLRWIDWTIGKIGQDADILLFGISMGGATMLMTSGEQLPEQVKGIISDCAYTSAWDILAFQLKKIYNLPAFPFIPATSLICRLRAGYWFGEASALKQVRQAKRPILFIHGQNDNFVPTEMVNRLYENCAAPKEKWIVPDAGHALSYFTDREGYIERVGQFIEKYVTKEEPAYPVETVYQPETLYPPSVEPVYPVGVPSES